MITKTLGNYTLDILKVEEFKEYYYNNLDNFTSYSVNSFLKALDIPPKFFKEQPLKTQEDLLDNREVFVRENKKFFDKVILVLRINNEILNACRLSSKDEEIMYAKLKTIDSVTNKFEHRSFIKDGYISYIISNDIKNNAENQVLALDFPILLNKKPVLHKAIYQLPDETFANPIEHIHYITSEEIDLDLDYKDIESAVRDQMDFLTDNERVKAEAESILRETELVSLALVENGTIPRSYQEKVSNYISENVKGELNTEQLESLILDFDEELRSYKQVTSLREVSGFTVLRLLESEQFKSLIESLDEKVPDFDPEFVTI